MINEKSVVLILAAALVLAACATKTSAPERVAAAQACRVDYASGAARGSARVELGPEGTTTTRYDLDGDGVVDRVRVDSPKTDELREGPMVLARASSRASGIDHELWGSLPGRPGTDLAAPQGKAESPDARETFDRDAQGRIVRATLDDRDPTGLLQPDGKPDRISEWHYTDAGPSKRVVRWGEATTEVTTFEYDSEGRLTTERTDLLGDGEVDAISVWVYDEENRPASRRIERPFMPPAELTYHYDCRD